MWLAALQNPLSVSSAVAVKDWAPSPHHQPGIADFQFFFLKENMDGSLDPDGASSTWFTTQSKTCITLALCSPVSMCLQHMAWSTLAQNASSSLFRRHVLEVFICFLKRFILSYVYECLACIYLFAPHTCLIALRGLKKNWIPLNWSVGNENQT